MEDEICTLPLSKGHEARLCRRGYEWARQWKWCMGSRYAMRSIYSTGDDGQRSSRTLYLHVELAREFGIAEAGKQVDHRDRDRLNNRLENLRAASPQQQQWNTSKHRGCSSIYKGIYWNKAKRRWRALIMVAGRQRLLGSFQSETAAADAYAVAAREHFGEFAGATTP